MGNRAHIEFERLWKQTSARIAAYMFCACHNWSDADDLAQECCLRALRSWGRFDGSGSRRAWLFAIARNARTDWFRKRGRDVHASQAENDREAPQVSAGPGTDDVEMVWSVVNGLEPAHREVIHLRFAVDLSYAEIAELLGVPLGTVRSRLHRGLKIAREQIKEQEHGT